MDTTNAIQSTSVQDAESSGLNKNTFGVVDYIVFVAMLLISASIGVFVAIQNRRKTTLTADAYLMAGRKMSYGPVSLSLIASFMSSVTILGVPSEYYIYGSMFTWFALLYVLMPFVVGWIYMPVFYDLGISSTYEYLERRFNKPTRLVTTFMYIILSILYGGIVVYGPALALSEVTGFDMWLAILSTGLVCIFYTTLGGLKAVIWTDVFQAFVMISGFIVVIIQGSINFGGFSNIWNAAEEGGRIDLNHFEFDPRIRHTFWSIMFGGTTLWIGINGVNQTQVQRYVCCRTKRDAHLAIFWNGFGLVVILVLAAFTGLTIYATYQHCDPINSGKINKSDQLFPFIVMDILGYIPGIPGLFVAGVYSSSLSTISSGMNAMACVTLEDFVRPYTRWRASSYTLFSRVMVLVYGVSYIMFAYLASHIGGLIRMAYSIHGVVSGPIVGLFSLGILFPFVNAWGALGGVILGWIITTWMSIGSIIYQPLPQFVNVLPRSVEGCVSGSVLTTPRSLINFTTVETASYNVIDESTSLFSTYDSSTGQGSLRLDLNDERPPIADFYALSYLYVSGIGCLVTLICGMLISLCTGMTAKNPPSNDLLCPLFYRMKEKKDPLLERSSSGSSPTHLANVEKACKKSSGSTPTKESKCFESFKNSPDALITSINSDLYTPEKESSF